METKYSTKIRIVRAGNRWTQEYLAKKLGVATTTLQRWENGKTIPPADKWDIIESLMPEI
jgi:transcriptional regulator with XRE-family HTH domain